MSNLKWWPPAAALSPLALLLAWSAADPSPGAATLALFLLVALAVVAVSG